MNQADVTKLVSALRYTVQGEYRRLRNPGGSQGRLDTCRKIVTALFKYERLELNYAKADEARGYAERVGLIDCSFLLTEIFYYFHTLRMFQLISDAVRHGDTHKETFDMANYWIMDKGVLHKLFKVLVPRFENFNTSYTRMVNAPMLYPAQTGKVARHYTYRSILELKGHPYPPIFPDDKMFRNRKLIHNVLLSEAKRDFYIEKKGEASESKSNRQQESSHPKSQVE